MNPDKGDYFSEYHVPEEYEYTQEDDYEEAEGAPEGTEV